MKLTTVAHEQCVHANIKFERFQEIVGRLLAWGIILRSEDATELRLYDDARRLETLLNDYFALGGFRLVHDERNEFFRLYAPGAQVPGVAEQDIAPSPSLRARLSPDFVAAALALRFLFQQGLTEGAGRLSDRGEVLIRFDELATTLQTQLRRQIPSTVSERDKVLRELKRHRLIDVAPTFSMENEDALIAIRPTILGIISEDALASALEAGDDLASESSQEEREANDEA